MMNVNGCFWWGVFTALLISGMVVAPHGNAEPAEYDAEPSGTYLRSWLLCGPFHGGEAKEGDEQTEWTHIQGFETDFLETVGGEEAVQPAPGMVVAHEGETREWFLHTSEEDVIDLDEAVSNDDQVVVCAYCRIRAAKPTPCVIALGTNDGCRVWLNGRRIWDHAEGRGVVLDQDLIPVVLNPGVNSLLIKIDEQGATWGLACRLLPPGHEALAHRLHPFKVVSSPEKAPILQYQFAAETIKPFMRSARIQVASSALPDRTIWEADWSRKPEMVIGVDASQYGEYVLHVKSQFKEGPEDTMKTYFTAGNSIEYPLFSEQSSDYAIVVGADASESERWAAEELQHWLREAGGAELPIVDDAGAKPERGIFVGYNRHTASLLGKAMSEAPDDSDESFTYRSIGPSILIWGGRDRGTMYGVFSFLERELGCRWYTPSVSVIPRKSSWSFRSLDHSEAPGIRVRNDFYHEAFEPIWAARNRVNGSMGTREQPGGTEGYWAVHTFYRFMPPAEFYDAHPEYYSLIDGKRVHANAQLCLTNPEVLNIVCDRLRKVMRETPGCLIYSVSQNDWKNPCQCEKCQAIAKREGSEAGPLLWFVNQVAERLEKEFPDKYVGTLAYQYTRKPPKTIKPRGNVVIRLCSIECCFLHDFKSCPENAEFLDDLQNWAGIAPHLYIWDYVVVFGHYLLPFPNFKVLQPNIQTFRENHAIGIMEQAAYQSRGGEFAELRAYLISKLLWNPDCDAEAVINDFMYGYYGRGGQYVRQYFDLLHAQVRPDTHAGLGLQPGDDLFSDEFIFEAEQIFDRAEAVADDEAVRQRIEMARLPIMYLKCCRLPQHAKSDGTYARFCEIAAREGITHYAERGQPHRLGFHARMDGLE